MCVCVCVRARYRRLGLYRCDWGGGPKETRSKSIESRKCYLSYENCRKFWVYKGIHDVRKEDLLFCYCGHCDNVMEWKIEGFHPGRSRKFISSPKRPDRFWGPPSFLLNGYRGLFFGANRPRRENLSSASSSEVKKEWSRTSTRHIWLHGVDWSCLHSLITFICLILRYGVEDLNHHAVLHIFMIQC